MRYLIAGICNAFPVTPLQLTRYYEHYTAQLMETLEKHMHRRF